MDGWKKKGGHEMTEAGLSNLTGILAHILG